MEKIEFFEILQTPIGELFVAESENRIVRIEFGRIQTTAKRRKTPPIAECEKQLSEYFNGKRKCFDIEYKLETTEFNTRVLEQVVKIEYGKTASYKAIAVAANSPGAARAVGNANNKNPLPILIPCHRVIGSNGKLVGYAGGIEIKRWLLTLERETV